MSKIEAPRTALVQGVVSELRESIQDGEWRVGSKLPTEAELLIRFGISRVTLRQAVQALVHVGILETIQGSGTYVRATHELEAVLHRFLTGADLRYVLEGRLAVESQAAEIAAVRATDEDLATIEALLRESRAAAEAGDFELFVRLSSRFHLAVVHAAHNPVLTQLYRGLEAGTEQSIREASTHQPAMEFVAEHDRLLRAIKRRDSKAALRLSREHLMAVLDVHTPGGSAKAAGPNADAGRGE